MRYYAENQDAPQTAARPADAPLLSPFGTGGIAPIYVTSGAGAIVVIAVTLFSLIILYVTSRNADSAAIGIWGTVIFFGIALPVSLMAANGSFARMYCYREEQRTARYHIQVFAPAQIEAAPPLQLEDRGPALPLPAPTFVAPVSDREVEAYKDAVGWLLPLYGKDGKPHPEKVFMDTKGERPGRLKVARPNKAALAVLLRHFVLHDIGNGYRLNMNRFGTRNAALQWQRTVLPSTAPLAD